MRTVVALFISTIVQSEGFLPRGTGSHLLTGSVSRTSTWGPGSLKPLFAVDKGSRAPPPKKENELTINDQIRAPNVRVVIAAAGDEPDEMLGVLPISEVLGYCFAKGTGL